MGTNLFYIGIIIGSIYLAIRWYEWQKKEKQQCECLKQLLKFIQDSKQRYMIHGRIEDAIYEMLYELEGEIQKEIQTIYDVLSDGREEVRRVYMKEQKNPFLSIFLALSYIEMEYGSYEERERFVQCISFLQQDMTQELWKREHIRTKFAGLSFLVLFPGFFLKAIEIWGVSNLPELSQYYKGTFGVLSLLGMGLCIYITNYIIKQLRFLLQNQWKEENDAKLFRYLEQKEWIRWILHQWEHRCKTYYDKVEQQLQAFGSNFTVEQFMIKRMVYGIGCFVGMLMMIEIFLWTGKAQALNGQEMFQIQALSPKRTEETLFLDGIKQVENLHKQERNVPKETIQRELYQYYGDVEHTMVEVGSMQVEHNIKQYQSYNFAWYHSFLCVIAWCIGYFLPKYQLLYEYEKKRQRIEEEFIYYETILLYLSKVVHMNEISMIEWLEEGNGVYERQFKKTLLSLYGGEEVTMIQGLHKEKTSHKERLGWILNGFVVSDQVGLAKAFQDMLMQRKNGQEQRKRQEEWQVQRFAMLAQIFAFLPLCFAIGIHLIVPFLMESMIQLSSILQQL